jgi:predicted ArsR family transcriptional regulator
MSRRTLRPHPTRDQILDVMRQHGKPISPVQLSRITGTTLGSTAYHVRMLLTAEVIEPAGEHRGVRGSTEHFYRLVAEDAAQADAVKQLLSLCGALTVHHSDGGGYPVPSEIDGDARAELEGLLDRLRPQVQQIAAASTARVRRRQS